MPSLVPELLDDEDECALHDAMSEAFCNGISDIWPHAAQLTLSDVEFVLVPLDRIGAAPGFSGSKVLIAYYAHASKFWQSSHPLVVKIGPLSKLNDEFDNGSHWAPIPLKYKFRFAKPMAKPFARGERGVLLAPFSSSIKPRKNSTRYDMSVDDLWRRLVVTEQADSIGARSWASSCNCIDELLELARVAHEGGRVTQPRQSFSYMAEYNWYLRGAFSPQTGTPDNTRLVTELFGTACRTHMFGREWANPLTVMERLVAERPSFEGAAGFIHGDLHPRNVVLDDNDIPHIIDFGWAQKDKHVVKDYVMLDINIRAMNAPSQVHPAEVLSLAEFLVPGTHHTGGDKLHKRASLIDNCIWKAAAPFVKDWLREYVTPLFMVGYGLLVHMDNARSQAALAATVLTCAERIERSLDEERV